MKTLWYRFRDRLRSGMKPVVLCDIKCTTYGGSWRCVSGEKKLFGWPQTFLALSPTKTGFDLREKRWEVGRTSLTFKGTWFRPIMSRYMIFGARVRLFLGFEDISESEFEETEFYRGIAGDPKPQGGEVILPVDPVPSVLLNSEIGGEAALGLAAEFSSMHPLTARKSIFDKARIPSELYDAASFDPKTYLWTDIAHWGIGRTGRNNNAAAPAFGCEITTPTKVLSLDQELCRILPAVTAIAPDGAMRCVRLSRGQKKVRHIPREDIIRCEQIGTHKNLTNEVALFLGQETLNQVSDKKIGLRRSDTNSQEFIRYPTSTIGRKIPEEESSPWLNQATRVHGSGITGAGPWTIVVTGAAARLGFSGAVLPDAQRVIGGAVPAEQQLNAAAGRYAYLLIEDFWTKKRDIFRATACTLDWGTAVHVDEYGWQWPYQITYTCDQHQLYDSSGDATTFDTSTGAFIYDVTIPVMYTLDRLDWMTLGNTEVRLQLNAKHWDLEPADAISFDDDEVCSMLIGTGGATEDTTWLIIDEQRDPLGGEPLTYTCIWLSTSFRAQVPTYTVSTIPIQSPWKDKVLTLVQDIGLKMRLGISTHHAVVSTFGFVATLAGGKVAGGHDENTGMTAQTALTMQSTRDNYVYRNAIDGHFTIKPVAVGAGEPTRQAGEVPLYMFTTSGIAITTTVDMRSSRVLDGSKLVADSVNRDVLKSPIEKDRFKVSKTEGDTQASESTAFRQTTLAGAITKLGSSVINEGESAQVIAKIEARRTAGGSSRSSWELRCHVYRDTAGNVTMTAAGVTTVYSDVDGSGYAAILDVDVGTQQVRVRVTGAAGQTVEWFGVLEVIRSFA